METAEGQLTYWHALEGTNECGPPTRHFDRAIQLYREVEDDVGLGETTFYRGLVYQMHDQNEPAGTLSDQALQLTEKIGNKHHQTQASMGPRLVSRGNSLSLTRSAPRGIAGSRERRLAFVCYLQLTIQL